MAQSPGIKKCARCAAEFVCGPSAGQATCWCTHLPHVMPLSDPAAGCLCPGCLQAEIDRRLTDPPNAAGERPA